MRTLLQLFAGCRHRRRSFPQHDYQSGRDYESCLDCGRKFESEIQFSAATFRLWPETKEKEQYASDRH